MNWRLIVAYTWPFWVLLGFATWVCMALSLFTGIPNWPKCTALVGVLLFGLWVDKSSHFYDWTVAIRNQPRP